MDVGGFLWTGRGEPHRSDRRRRVLVPEVSSGDARYLSKKASDINGAYVIWCFIGAMVVGGNVPKAVVVPHVSAAARITR
jgi:hypothetical protein